MLKKLTSSAKPLFVTLAVIGAIAAFAVFGLPDVSLGGGLVSLVLAALCAGLGFSVFRLRRRTGLLTAALDNMPQGLCMFDASASLVLCNARFVEMYRLDAARVKPGMSL